MIVMHHIFGYEKDGDKHQIESSMIIKGDENNPYYKLWSNKLNDYIFVTGSHLIQDPKTMRFIKVKDYDKSISTELYGEKFSCLVTSTNTIPIGEFTFFSDSANYGFLSKNSGHES